MAKEKDTTKKLKRLNQQLKKHDNQPLTREGIRSIIVGGKTVKVPFSTLTRKSRIQNAIKTLTNNRKRK